MNRCLLTVISVMLFNATPEAQERVRARELGISPGSLPPGRWNAITDVEGVRVGHRTLVRGDAVRTGVTVIVPHGGNPFMEKVPAAAVAGNGFGKAVGFTQVGELGNLETPVALTNTLSIFTVAGGLVEYILSLEGNGEVRSVNPVAGETNDGWLNDIRGRHVEAEDVLRAIEKAEGGAVEEGNAGAGTGTLCLGYKGGIGTSSRVVPLNGNGHGARKADGGSGSAAGHAGEGRSAPGDAGEDLSYTVGVLVQTNFGGNLTILGIPVGKELNRPGAGAGPRPGSGPRSAPGRSPGEPQEEGSCMIVIATDAPLDSRNLERLAKRSFLALGRVGSVMSNGSGDYAIAFSTHPGCRIPHAPEAPVLDSPALANDWLTPLFGAVVEATEEAIYNALFRASDMEGFRGRRAKALPVGPTLRILEKHGISLGN